MPWPEPADERVQGSDNMKSHVLPNGLEVKHTNLLETVHLYQDIFVMQVYLQHGITLRDNAVVIDGGANIGMFSLFVLVNCPTAYIHAFEPAPKTFQVLQANLSVHPKAVANNCGLGSHAAEEWFMYMPAATTASGYFGGAMISEMKQQMRSAILADPDKSRPYKGPLGEELLVRHLNESLRGQLVRSMTRSLSDYFDEKQISRVDILKLDVECRECAVLAGIRDEHWPFIQQIVIEVHSRVNDALPEVLEILGKRGFTVVSVPEKGRLTTMAYARRLALQ